MTRLRARDKLLLFFVLALVAFTAVGQVPATALQIQGIIQSNKTPLPGVVVAATRTDEVGVAITTATDINGQYLIKVPAAGKYRISTELAAFAPESKEVEVSDPSKAERVDFDLVLQSRAQRTSQPAAPNAGAPGNRGGNTAVAEPAETPVDPLASAQPDTTLANQGVAALPGMSADAPTESVAVAGNTASPAFGGMFDADRLAQLGFGGDFGAFGGLVPGGQRGDGSPGDTGAGGRGDLGGRGGPPGGFGPGGRGGPGGPRGFGGRGGPGGRGGFVLAGQRGRRNLNRPNFNFAYTLADSVFDAAPYSLRGAPADKPQYSQNRFNGTIGGPLIIPKIIHSASNTFYNVTVNGSLSKNPFDVFSTVPTLAERSGDFSDRAIQLRNPLTGEVFDAGRIPSSMINPAAAGLLKYIPEPNLPGATQNFHFVTTNENNGADVNVRINHTFGSQQAGQRGARGGGGFGGRSGSGGGVGRGGGFGGRGRGAISIGFQYRTQNNTSNNPFPALGGNNRIRGLNIPVNFTRSFGRLLSNSSFSYNRNRTVNNNLFSNRQDIAAALGITGVSNDPADWGLPTLTFTNYSSLNDVRPSLRLNQIFSAGESLAWFHGKHNFRFGGDYRYSQLQSHTGTNARGTFTFNGAATGIDLADFLLGLPQLTSVQYGSNDYKFRGAAWSAYFQDDWRVRGTLTVNLGLRYDYTAPLTEANNRLVNLDAAPDFSAVATVLPGAIGPFSGVFPKGLLNPDRNNWAPQVGLAWRAMNRMIVRAGYGVTYNSGVYNSMVQQFAFQPPFSVTQTNIASSLLPLTLQNGFPVPSASTVTNNFGVDKNYRIGYAQTWNLSVQRELTKAGLTMTVDYTGTKGTRLDILQAPNRTATGLRIPGVEPFTWESSTGNSIAHVARVQLRRRLQYGISVGGNYSWSKSIDNASSFGAAAGNIAQNALDLTAERALSNFDQPHRFTGDYLWQLPFGRNRRWMNGNGFASKWFGDWQLNGAFNFASGVPFTARVIGDVSDIRRGTNGTLRANVTGLPVSLDNSTADLWFNTGAFTLPAPGTYGTAGRNSIRGPGTHQLDMSLNKSFAIGDRNLDIRLQATNFLNSPQFRLIDTTVNSPSFGRVLSVGSMRKIQLIARYRF